MELLLIFGETNFVEVPSIDICKIVKFMALEEGAPYGTMYIYIVYNTHMHTYIEIIA